MNVLRIFSHMEGGPAAAAAAFSRGTGDPILAPILIAAGNAAGIGLGTAIPGLGGLTYAGALSSLIIAGAPIGEPMLAQRKALQGGTVVAWNADRGFGFLEPDDGGPDVFVHISAWPDHLGDPRPGVRVMFDIGRDKRNPSRLRASTVAAMP